MTQQQTSIKVPLFWPTNPTVWFLQIEAQFYTRGITSLPPSPQKSPAKSGTFSSDPWKTVFTRASRLSSSNERPPLNNVNSSRWSEGKSLVTKNQHSYSAACSSCWETIPCCIFYICMYMIKTCHPLNLVHRILNHLFSFLLYSLIVSPHVHLF